jgi:hypothetical protein
MSWASGNQVIDERETRRERERRREKRHVPELHHLFSDINRLFRFVYQQVISFRVSTGYFASGFNRFLGYQQVIAFRVSTGYFMSAGNAEKSDVPEVHHLFSGTAFRV